MVIALATGVTPQITMIGYTQLSFTFFSNFADEAMWPASKQELIPNSAVCLGNLSVSHLFSFLIT